MYTFSSLHNISLFKYSMCSCEMYVNAALQLIPLLCCCNQQRLLAEIAFGSTTLSEAHVNCREFPLIEFQAITVKGYMIMYLPKSSHCPKWFHANWQFLPWKSDVIDKSEALSPILLIFILCKGFFLGQLYCTNQQTNIITNYFRWLYIVLQKICSWN